MIQVNKIFLSIGVLLLVFAIDLFHWEALPRAARDLAENSTTEAVAASNSAPELDFEFSLDSDFHFQNSGATPSTTAAPILDPITLLLLGSGLIGLAGLGAKKIKK